MAIPGLVSRPAKQRFPRDLGQRCVNTRWPVEAPLTRGFVVLGRSICSTAPKTQHLVFADASVAPWNMAPLECGGRSTPRTRGADKRSASAHAGAAAAGPWVALHALGQLLVDLPGQLLLPLLLELLGGFLGAVAQLARLL